ncbi:Lrp/AsnC family transcriptional regulator [Spirulina subsalsa FACHB-351]|uniref:Lrp/AsnC family transcriptional regulator n=1 Tax=Spirulina subsalsa FACHB-351 TaxID=234711 RepID=A0ABT3L5A9_9CYAN|nr:Lrp/AsnC family transcriptional regulator [Spirulina subsalsa]MCW6036175.1 Lrp/AsnC family transcriptional regulator [Spirulina subsalsa FACHB-351]
MQLDHTDWQLLKALQKDARLSFSELGRRVGLSPPAVTERVRKLEESGIVAGYGADLNPGAIGLPILAFIQLTTSPEHYQQVIALMQELPEILECHHVTGNTSFVVRAIASSLAHLEQIIGKLSQYGQTSTSVVLSSPVTKKPIASQLIP